MSKEYHLARANYYAQLISKKPGMTVYRLCWKYHIKRVIRMS